MLLAFIKERWSGAQRALTHPLSPPHHWGRRTQYGVPGASPSCSAWHDGVCSWRANTYLQHIAEFATQEHLRACFRTLGSDRGRLSAVLWARHS